MKMIQGSSLKKFNDLYHEMDQFYHNIALQSGLSDSAFWIFYTICEHGDGCLQRDISNLACASKQTVHSAIHKLEQEGYLYLEQGKGRDKHIHLTRQGEELIEEVIVPVVELENAAFAEMGTEETQELLRLTKKYTGLLYEKFKKGVQ